MSTRIKFNRYRIFGYLIESNHLDNVPTPGSGVAPNWNRVNYGQIDDIEDASVESCSDKHRRRNTLVCSFIPSAWRYGNGWEAPENNTGL